MSWVDTATDISPIETSGEGESIRDGMIGVATREGVEDQIKM